MTKVVAEVSLLTGAAVESECSAADASSELVLTETDGSVQVKREDSML